MATTEQIQWFIHEMILCRPKKGYDTFDKNGLGMGHAIRYLYKHDGQALPSELSRELHVSSARMAVVLRKMEEQGVISRKNCPGDARKSLVVLTEKGSEVAVEKKREIDHLAEEIIDRIGMERLTEFIEISKEMRNICDESFSKL